MRSLEQAGPETLADKASERTLHTNWTHSKGEWDTRQGEPGIRQ